MIELLCGPDQAPDVLDRADAAKLDETGAGDGIDRLTGSIRYEMQMGTAHANSPFTQFRLWTATPNKTQAGDKSGLIPNGSENIQA